ncbi:MAG: bifunctional UDP-3-O-[3-hydroxymyristoyl] N-acetylglucosamine deacetylase/3-hydroxyacyl-ACP dehydratase [Bacteroidota bacterium]|jgi:UDP-3-O-[3-hydroxymyristoyl] N-acetylglucosamine deacetylase/3-hydroxyacyl-[acyl-carrier-protein] dehydratase
MTEKQRTLKSQVTISGVGLHTGATANLTLCPAQENFGYKFQRIDIEEQPIIEADCDLVVDTARGTTLGKNNVKVYTIEHVLAALVGMQVDNCLIKIDAQEVPILDGSSKPYIDAIISVGFEEQKAERDYFVLTENLTFEDPIKKAEMLAVPSEDYRITVMVDYNSPLLGTQHASMYHIGEFKEDISSCRTFCFVHELEFLVKNNLIKGGDLSNAIVICDRDISQEKLDELALMLNKPAVKIVGKGYLNNVQLQYQNEPARHKLLDIVGDLALAGKPIKGHILAARPGHSSNVEFAKIIKQKIQEVKKKKNELPQFDLNAEPLMNVTDIMKLLPHRPPFLLIDKILELTETRVVGLKNVTMNESFFVGHFPDNPVMPGVLQVEAMAQTGGVLVLKTVPDPENYLTYFMKIEQVKFKNKVLPGDTIIFALELVSPIRRGLCHMKGQAIVGNKVVMEAEMLAQIVKVK